MTNGIRTLTVATLALTGLLRAAADVWAQLPSNKVYALLVLDSLDPYLGAHMEKDRANIEAFLKSGIGEGLQDKLLKIKVLERERATTKNVFDYFKDLPVTPQDTVLFYFSGHGGTEQNAGREHLLQLKGSGKQEFLRRGELRQAMQATRARLVILLTDSCSNYVMPVKKKDQEIAFAPIGRATIRPAFRRLFLEEKGLVDINATLEGSFAWSDQDGGLFTRDLRQTFEDVKDDRDIDWKRFGGSFRAKSETLFVSWKGSTIASLRQRGEWNPDKEEAHKFLHKQPTQAPQVFSLPGASLGVGVQGTDGKGVKVIAFTLGSAVERAGIKQEEIIIGINGMPIEDTSQWTKATDQLLQTTRQFEFTVQNVQGQTRKVKVSLDP